MSLKAERLTPCAVCRVGLAYRVLDMSPDELGAPANRKFDIEVKNLKIRIIVSLQYKLKILAKFFGHFMFSF